MSNRLSLVFAFVSSATILSIACSSSSVLPPYATLNFTDGGKTTIGITQGPGGGGGLDASLSADGGTCPSLPSLVGLAPVTTQYDGESTPNPIGGTIPDGTYVLTSDTIYTSPGGTTGPGATTYIEVQVFSGGTIVDNLTAAVGLDAGAATTNAAAASGTYNTVGDQISFTFTCTGGADLELPTFYSVINSTIQEYVGTNVNEVRTFTLQQ